MDGLYLDEEDCLGAELFASELELLVGSIKLRGRLDQVQLLELLPKLAATIPKADRASLKALQKRCEPAFTEMIGLGVCTTVRRLIAVCLTRFYIHGDVLGIYSRVHSLQTALNTREQGKGGSTWQQLLLGGGAAAGADRNGAGEGGGLSDGVRAGMLELLAHLSLHHGRFLASAAATNMVISKNGSRSSSKLVRIAALRLAAATVEGLHPRDRAVPEVQAEAFALFQRSVKDLGCTDTQAAAAALVSAIARGGGSALWRDGCYYWDEALRLCSAHVNHPCQAVRDGYAMALCDLSVAVSHEVLEDVINAEKRAAKKAALVRLRAGARGEVLQKTLVQPLVSAALQGSRAACASLSLAWTSYIAWVAAKEGDAVLVDLAVQVVQLCDAAAARAQSEPHAVAGPPPGTHLGEAHASGELPHIQACALYILRSAVIEALTESSQKALLQQLVGLLMRPSCAVPTSVVALEGLSILMDVLGEVGEEEGGTLLEAAVISQVPSLSAAVRHQAAAAAAALAAVQPQAAARLLGGLLDSLEASTQLLAESRPAHPAASPPAFTTLMGKPQVVLLATAHGAALAAAGLLMVAAHLPLSVPSITPRRAYALAAQLIRQPNSDAAVTRCAEREAGYILLGALICSWEGAGEEAAGYLASGPASSELSFGRDGAEGPQRGPSGSEAKADAADGGARDGGSSGGAVGLASQGGDALLALLAVAAGHAAREDLGENGYTGKEGGEARLSMQLRWRALALQALHVHMGALQAKGPHADSTAQVQHIAMCLAQLLAVVESQRYLQEPVKAMGGPSGVVAADAACFQVRLLQCVRLLPIDQLPPASQATLTKLCSYPVKMATIAMCGSLSAAEAALPQPSLLGLQTGAMEVLHQAVLRHVLEKEDDVLGPWLLGRDTAEDELHAFAGEQGGPHQLPWELPLLQALYSDKRGRGAASRHASPSSSGVPHGMLWMAAQGAVSPVGHTTHGAKDGSGGVVRGALYPQPIGLGPALLTAQVAVLGQLLSQSPQGAQLNILDDCIQCASAGKAGAVRRVGRDGLAAMVTTTFATTTPGLSLAEQDAAARRLGASTLAAIVALSGLMPLVRQPPTVRAASMGSAEAADKVAGRVLQLANALLEGGGAAEPGIARAGAQMLAASACLGSDVWAGKVVSALSDEVTGSVADGRDKQRRAALCLALSCVHRAKGGLVLQALIPSTTAALVVAARHPADSAIALWALHSLTIMAQSTGPGYLQHVHSTFTLCRDLLVGGYDAPGLRPMCARLANAMVGVLGPEFKLGSPHYAAAKSLITDLGQAGVLAVDDPPALAALCSLGSSSGAASSPGPSDAVFAAPRPITMEALACELQAVLFAQQLILFAPKAIQASKHVPMLQITLLSRRPALRKAAAATLRHLAERDPHMLLAARLEGALFASLDGEANAAIAGQLRASLEALLVVGAPLQPAYWLACLAEVVFSSGGKGGTGHDAAGAGAVEGSESEEEEEEEEEEEDVEEDEDMENEQEVGRKAGGVEWKGKRKRKAGERKGQKGSEGGAAEKNQPELAASENGVKPGKVKAGAAGDEKGSKKDGTKQGPKTKAKPTEGRSAAAAAAAAAAAGVEGAGTMQALLATVALRLRTRLFAAELVHKMLQVAEQRCAADPLELVPSRAVGRRAEDDAGSSCTGPGSQAAAGARAEAASHAPRDKMVDHLQEFVEVGYKISIGPVEALKPYGVWLLRAVLHVFGSVEDPLLPGARLLENHQALLVGALRAALAPATSAAGPVLAIAGGQLATTFLESGLAAGDSKVMKRLLELLSSPLATGGGLRAERGAYAEWVGTVHTLALLQAHAQCAAIARHEGNELVLEEVSAAHEPHRQLLSALWAALLQDHAILSTQPPHVLRNHPSALLLATSAAAEQLGDAAGPAAAHVGNKDAQLPSQAAAVLAAALSAASGGAAGSKEEEGITQRALAGGAVMRVYRGFRSMAVAAAQGSRGGRDGASGAIMSSQVVQRVRAAYGAAAPMALRALSLGYYPDAQQLAASQREGTVLYQQYCILLDVALILVPHAAQCLAGCVQACLENAASKESNDVAVAASSLESCILGLHGLMGPAHLGADLVAQPLVVQALEELKGVVMYALVPLQRAVYCHGCKGWAAPLAALVAAASGFLKELAQSVPAHMLVAPAAPAHTPPAEKGQGRHSSGGNGKEACTMVQGNSGRDSGGGQHASMCDSFVDSLLALSSMTTPFTLQGHAQAPAPPAAAQQQQQQHQQPAARSAEQHMQHQSSPAIAAATTITGNGGVHATGHGPLVTMQPVRLDLPAGVPPTSTAAADGALVALLVAAQALVRKADMHTYQQQQQQQHQSPEATLQLLPPLLHLSARLLLTAPPGVQLHAAQRFFDTHLLLAHAAAERLACMPGSPGAARLVAAAEGAVLQVAHALRAGVQELKAGDAARQEGSHGRKREGDREVPGEEGGLSQVQLSFCRDQGPVCLSTALSACAPLYRPSADGSSTSGTAATGPALCTYVLGVVAEVLQLPGSCNHAEPSVEQVQCEPAEDAESGSEEGAEEDAAAAHAAQQQQAAQAVAAAAAAAVAAAAAAARAEVVDALQAKAAEGVRMALQEGKAAEAHSRKVAWAHQVLGLAGPVVAELAHARLQANADAQQQQQASVAAEQQLPQRPGGMPRLLPLSQGSVAVVAECVKVLVAAAHFAGASQGPEGQEAVMQVLLPLLVLAAAPPPPALPTLALKELAVKLITTLPASAMAGSFKAALANLPVASKQRLQAALKEPEVGLVAQAGGDAYLASARQMGMPCAAGVAAARPTIQLKTTFAIPK